MSTMSKKTTINHFEPAVKIMYWSVEPFQTNPATW